MTATNDPAPVPVTRLLVVDDEPSILSAIKRVFRGTGYEILTATSGRDGLALLEHEAVAAVISDMRMPEMDGAQFLEQVFVRWPDTKRILLTGYADTSATIAAINRGKIWRYVSKPWNDEEFRHCAASPGAPRADARERAPERVDAAAERRAQATQRGAGTEGG